MKILVVGAGGMLGHKMTQILSETFPDTYAGIRKPFSEYERFGVFRADRVVQIGNVTEWGSFESVLNELKPDVIINCIAVTLRKEMISNLEYVIEINAMFPHRLKCWAAQNKSHVIHFSTDCVFDGTSGPYHEESQPSAKDDYGRTKYLGEIVGPHALTLRGSMIGRELTGKTELLEWAISEKNKSISGYAEVVFSGVTAEVMSRLVAQILKRPTLLAGLYHVSSEPISKYELLKKFNKAFALNLDIVEDTRFVSKKDLRTKKIREDVGFVCPSWDEMINQMANDKTTY